MNATRRIAEHVVRTGYVDLPAAAVAAGKTFVLDTLGVAVAGSASPVAARLAEGAAGWGKGDDATVWGPPSGCRRPAPRW